MPNECTKCKSKSLRTQNVQIQNLGGLWGNNAKAIICNDCGYVEFYATKK